MAKRQGPQSEDTKRYLHYLYTYVQLCTTYVLSQEPGLFIFGLFFYYTCYMYERFCNGIQSNIIEKMTKKGSS